MNFSFFKRDKGKNLFTIAFYNLENLFDTIDDNDKLDSDFTPNGMRKWTDERYERKLLKLARTISKIGFSSTNKMPVLLGIAEVENEKAIKDLLGTAPLKDTDYGHVHYDSPDERGIDTALVYHKQFFNVLYSEPIALLVRNLNGERDTTRDILYVHGTLNGEEVHIFVNHWPSRREGGQETDYKRIRAAETIKSFMERIEERHGHPNYIVMGDFNDDPSSESIRTLVRSGGLYNPMEKLHLPFAKGSTIHNRSWFLFDQIMLSYSFLDYEKGTHSFAFADVFAESFLREYEGKYKGNPYRTFAGKKYLGGYSDHFPVYVQLKYNG